MILTLNVINANQINVSGQAQESALLIGVQRRGVPVWEVNDHLDELELLLDTAGGRLIGRIVQERDKLDAGTFLGSGKVAELAGIVKATGADIVIFDDDLSPAQTRNLEKALECKVIDRSGLILDIFACRARSREARIQVELARLTYLLPRLTRRWIHLSRQYGGIGARRGPGETQLEVDRRVLSRRISQLRGELSRIEKARETRRRKRSGLFKAAIIGYTNAGKSTLLNALTHAEVFVEDRLFATLDATARAYRLPDGARIVLIDTVGFIRKLPVGLLASFKSTLEESRQADLFLLIVDLSHPHWEGQMARVEEILKELELDHTPQILLFNKVDKVNDPALLEGLKRQYPGALFISALRGIRLYELPPKIAEFAQRRWVRGEEGFRPDEIERMHLFEEQVQVIGRSFKDGKIWVDYMKVETN
ncbi:MAG: GTPase HflX [Calditrichaeota bacterium]|nr:GTPase HflX [Calditrichota bacterium]